MFDEDLVNKQIDALYNAKRAAEELFKKDLVQMLEDGFEKMKDDSFYYDPFSYQVDPSLYNDIEQFTSDVRRQNEAEIPFGSKPVLSLKPIRDYDLAKNKA